MRRGLSSVRGVVRVDVDRALSNDESSRIVLFRRKISVSSGAMDVGVDPVFSQQTVQRLSRKTSLLGSL